MLSYYKKVFLFPIRFGFLGIGIDDILSFGGDLITSAGKSFAGSAASSLVGGSTSETDPIALALQKKKELQDLAGKESETSLDKVESMGTTVGKNIGEFGRKMAGDFMDQVSEKFVGNTVERMFNRPVNPMKQGMRQRAFTSAAFPGVNPWELSGGSAGGGSGGVGGTAAPMIGARAQRQSANVAARPKLEEVSIKYQKAPHEIGVLKGQKDVLGEKKEEIHEHTREQKALNLSLGLLNDATTKERQLRTTEAHRKTDISLYKGGTTRAGESRPQQVAESEIRQDIQKGAQSLIHTGILEQQKNVAIAHANLLKMMKDTPDLAKWMPLVGILLSLIGGGMGVAAIRGIGKNIVKPKGKKQERGGIRDRYKRDKFGLMDTTTGAYLGK